MALPQYSKKTKQAFVDAYVKTRVGTTAACSAGLTKKSALSSGSRLKKDPEVAKAINDAEKLSPTAAAYNLEKAMVEAEEAKQFAEQTSNANAYVKAIELKAKLAGLLEDKSKIPMLGAGFQVVLMGFRDYGQSLAPQTQQIPPGEVIDVTHQIAPPEDFQVDPDVDPFGE